MPFHQITFDRAVMVADHLKAIGYTDLYLNSDDPNLPWSSVTDIENGATWRHSIPVSVTFNAKHAPSGLSFRWTVDLETRDANGTGVIMFNREAVRDMARKLPAGAREELAYWFEESALPSLHQQVKDLRRSLSRAEDSLDCVKGVIDFVREPSVSSADGEAS